MVTRKIWVKRPLASATLITINEDDLVDDVRELILRKYANSLGRQFDAPDLTLRVYDRAQQITRMLQPDEPMGRTLDAYYPNGQAVDDALLIDIPSRRTPKASPNPRFYGEDHRQDHRQDHRPHESGNDYFPPYPPAPHAHHPGPPAASTASLNGPHTIQLPHSMAIVGGGQLPLLPSPGGTRRLAASRPKIPRMHTASPVSSVGNTLSQNHSAQSVLPSTGTHSSTRPPRSRTHSVASSEQSSHPPAAPPMPTPPPAERVATPPPRVASPRPSARAKKTKKIDHPSLPAGMLDGAVPPINVLIVEDNIINLKLLEAFVKRLKVRWQTAMNGEEAVKKWRAGGFHLVLMDIQLPVMNGLDATREIRRIEKVNSIGVFSSSASSPPEETHSEPAEEDKLTNTEMFKSPVIIVALTASSLQSDRHEALAAGCNDFLTKPVNFVWLERKVKEWGCMQALIDFDGWRKWKDFSQKAEENAAAAKAKAPKKNRLSMATAAA
ncbi:CheY-like protein [Xylariaceae sp. FL0804]|nr:CheY-like protein [Xylariaceae sp. FL0804]